MTCCFFHNGIYMPNRLTFLSDLSAIPQTPCPSAFRLKDMHCEMFQPKKYPSGKPIPQESEEPPIRLKDSNLQLKNSRAQSFSRNTDRQGICEQAEAFEGFFGVFSIEHDSDQIVIAKRKNDIATTTLPTRMQVLHPCQQ